MKLLFIRQCNFVDLVNAFVSAALWSHGHLFVGLLVGLTISAISVLGERRMGVA
jgi:hypothetical protein